MLKSVVAATAILTLGMGSALAAQGNPDQGTWFMEMPGQFAHAPQYQGRVFGQRADHGTWFIEMPGQFAHPPHYQKRVFAQDGDHGTWFIEMPGQFAKPAFK